MNKLLLAASAVSLVLASSGANAADSTAARIDKLEKEIQLLKRQQEVKEEKATAASEKSANVEIGSKGLAITSPDKKYGLEMHGFFQLDNRSFVGDKNGTGRNDNIVRRARPVFIVKAGDATFNFMPDFAGTSSTSNNTKVMDAFAEYKFSDAAKVRVGKFKSPIGLEELQSDPDTLFAERGYAALLAPQRDVGLQLGGTVLSKAVEYQVGLFDGAVDNGNTDGDSDDKKDVAARVFAKPFLNSSIVPLQGLGVGVGGSIGERESTATSTNKQLPTYVTLGQQTFFSYTPTAGTPYADGEQWRLQPQAYWFSGNKGLIAEYAITSQHVVNGTKRADLQHTAVNLAASYVITGEDSKFKDGVKPYNDFSPSQGGWGAFEVVARFGLITIDSDTFPTFASTTTSAKKATSYGAGLNWYLSENLKLSTNYNYTQFDAGATVGDRPKEQVIQSRLQFRF